MVACLLVHILRPFLPDTGVAIRPGDGMEQFVVDCILQRPVGIVNDITGDFDIIVIFRVFRRASLRATSGIKRTDFDQRHLRSDGV